MLNSKNLHFAMAEDGKIQIELNVLPLASRFEM